MFNEWLNLCTNYSAVHQVHSHFMLYTFFEWQSLIKTSWYWQARRIAACGCYVYRVCTSLTSHCWFSVRLNNYFQFHSRKKINSKRHFDWNIHRSSSMRECVLNATIQTWLIALRLLQDDDEEIRLVHVPRSNNIIVSIHSILWWWCRKWPNIAHSIHSPFHLKVPPETHVLCTHNMLSQKQLRVHLNISHHILDLLNSISIL
jgi:hypothetical protein